MSKGKTHIDQYFKEKVKTQQGENKIPSFEAFMDNNNVSVTKGISSFTRPFLYGIASITVIVVFVFFAMRTRVETVNTSPQQVIIEPSVVSNTKNVELIEDTVKEVQVLPVVKIVLSHEINVSKKKKKDIASKTVIEEIKDKIQTSETKEVRIEPSVVDVEVKELANDKVDITEKKESKEESVTGFDLFMKKHISDEEKGVELYEKK